LARQLHWVIREERKTSCSPAPNKKMKNTVFLALMILAVLPASAQTAASPNCSVNSETMAALAADYASRVDGLLRDAHANLQRISEDVEAGNVTSEQAQALKLAATRDMISRLDAISAVYDARFNAHNGVDCGSQGSADATGKTSNPALKTNATVSVAELKREAATVLATAGTKQVTR
jgi:hypothetical protein